MDPHQTKIYYAILVAAGILGIIVIYFIATIVRNQRRHLKLQQANLLVEITTLENERKRIVSDLHDELGPLLSVVKFQVSSLETTDTADVELIAKANENLDTILERIRGICNQMLPQVLTRKGLLAAVSDYVAELDNHSEIKFNFTHDPNVVIPAEAEIHLYRIIQEIINNAVKHSGAHKIEIRISSKKEKVIITINDDGKGFDTETAGKESGGYGFKNILSRVDILKGDLYLASTPGKGTTYSIEIPGA